MAIDIHDQPFPEGAAFILGGSGGLGRGICLAFARWGVPVAFTYHGNVQAADELSAEIRALGVEVIAYQLNAGDRDAVFQTLEKAATKFGALHSVVYAGGPSFEPTFFARIKPEVFRDWLDNDVMGCINLAQAAIPYLRNTRGAFVTLSTYQNNMVEVRGSISAISKAGLDRMVAAIAKEEGRYGVRANSVRAGWFAVKGPLQLLEDIPGLAAEKAKTIPVGRLGYPEELGETVVFLCSRRGGFISGQNIVADGGESL
jgi:NAD(P)-dependent dehydrogenase (short-subunit alcohol dehydrogenase family)